MLHIFQNNKLTISICLYLPGAVFTAPAPIFLLERLRLLCFLSERLRLLFFSSGSDSQFKNMRLPSPDKNNFFVLQLVRCTCILNCCYLIYIKIFSMFFQKVNLFKHKIHFFFVFFCITSTVNNLYAEEYVSLNPSMV